MKPILILFAAALYISTDTKAQAPENSVKAIVKYLFTARKNPDACILIKQ